MSRKPGPWNRWPGHGSNPAPKSAWIEVLFQNGRIGLSEGESRCWNDDQIVAWRCAEAEDVSTESI